MLLPGTIPSHSGWLLAFEVDDSPARFAQDLDNMKQVRGSLDFAQWRISSRAVLVANSDSSTPVGLFAQAPMSPGLGPRF